MSVPVAYATIMIIWSTTPLGIAWSNHMYSPITALMLRMCVAAFLGWIILRALKIELAWHGQALRSYSASLLGVYGAMFCVYSAAAYIPSGLISLLFALAPIISNMFAIKLLGQNAFTRQMCFSFVLSFFGLAVICSGDAVIAGDAWKGILLLMAGVSLYSLSGVLVQKVGFQAHSLSITVGTLISSLPFFVVTWLLVDGNIPDIEWGNRSTLAVLYLATFGSLLGFAAYFYVVKTLGAISVAMVTLVTPVFALLLGSLFNDEQITLQIVFGTAFVLTGLAMYFKDAGLLSGRESEL